MMRLQPVRDPATGAAAKTPRGEVELGFPEMPGCVVATGDAVRDLALMPAMLEAPPRPEPSSSGGGSTEGEEEGDVYDHDRYFHQNSVWAQSMRLLGGRFLDLSIVHDATVQMLWSAVEGGEE